MHRACPAAPTILLRGTPGGGCPEIFTGSAAHVTMLASAAGWSRRSSDGRWSYRRGADDAVSRIELGSRRNLQLVTRALVSSWAARRTPPGCASSWVHSATASGSRRARWCGIKSAASWHAVARPRCSTTAPSSRFIGRLVKRQRAAAIVARAAFVRPALIWESAAASSRLNLARHLAGLQWGLPRGRELQPAARLPLS